MCNDNKNMNEEELKKVDGGTAEQVQAASCRPDLGTSTQSTGQFIFIDDPTHEISWLPEEPWPGL